MTPTAADAEAARRILGKDAPGTLPPHERVAGLPGVAECKHDMYGSGDRLGSLPGAQGQYDKTPYRHHEPMPHSDYGANMCQCGNGINHAMHLKAGERCV